MNGTAIRAVMPTIARLDWECHHFGIVVAELTDPDLDDADLAGALRLARAQGIRRLVWATHADRCVPTNTLDSFDGILIDRKATFSRQLEATSFITKPGPTAEPAVIPYSSSTASPALIELAISAGVHSRFHTDRQIPKAKSEAMYRVWIERSVAKELADVVFYVPPIAGFITVSESAGTGRIGLIAVAAESRGRGVGAALILAAHRWMLNRGAHQAHVVTQLANTPACRLYERCGYTLFQLQNIYHFWL